MIKNVSGNNTKSNSKANRKIVIWCLHNDEGFFNNLVDIYCKSVGPDVEFDICGIETSEDMHQRFAVSSGDFDELPDIIVTSDYNEYLTQYSYLFLNLNKYINTNIFASEGIVGNLMKNGKLMGFPISSGVAAFYYNRGIFDECGIEIPENYTIEEFLDYAQTIHDNFGGDKYILAYTNDLARIFMQSTGKLFYKDGKIVYGNVMKLFEFFEELHNRGGVLISSAYETSEIIDLLASETVCGVIGAPYLISRISNIVSDYGLGQEWGIVPLPKSHPFIYNVSLYEKACLVVNKSDEEKLAIIVDFLIRSFTDYEEVPVMMVEEEEIVPTTNYICDLLENEDYPECFCKNVYTYLASMLTNVASIEHGEDTDEYSAKLEKLAKKVITGVMNASEAYDKFVEGMPPEEPEPPRLVNIEIATLPDKTEYYIYDTISLKGSVVMGHYNDGTIKEVESYQVEPIVFEEVGIQKVAIICKQDSEVLYAYFNVEVKNRQLVGISVTDLHRIFLQGDTLSNDDFLVSAIYNLGEPRYVNDFDILNRALTEVGEKTVEFSYYEREDMVSCTTTINVLRRLTGLTIVEKPKKLMYYSGDRLDTGGMMVVASYSNGTESTISNGGISVSPNIIEFKNGQNTAEITVSHSEYGVEATAKLTVYKKTGVEIDDCNIEQDFGVSGNGAVNVSSGSMYYVFKDFICSDSDFPIQITRTYRRDAGNRGVGDGWRLNLQQEIIRSVEHWKYIDKKGKEYIFDNGFSTADGRSAIRNEELGFDLFTAGDGSMLLIDRSNNTLVFNKINGVYRLSAVHKYPSTTDNPIAPYSMQIVHNPSTGYITKVSAGRVIDGERRNVTFVYTGGLLTQLQYNFASSTAVAEYEYDGNTLVKIKKSNGNVRSPYAATTEFKKTDSSFTIWDMSSKDGSGNCKSLIYTLDKKKKVSAVSVGYGETDRETTSVHYTDIIVPTEDDNPVTDIVASCYTEYNGTLSVTSFNSLCSAATYSYEKGDDGTYAKPKKVYNASSRGFDYQALADSYSDTLDMYHDDFANKSVCGWTGGTINTAKCIGGTASLIGNTLRKIYTVNTDASDGVTLYLSLWVLANGSAKISVSIDGSRGQGSFTHKLDNGLSGKWQFTAFNLGKAANKEKITVKIEGYDVCIDDIRLTRAPYETPEDIAQPEYNAFGNIEKQYKYSPVDGKVACSTYKYDAAHQLTEKNVTVNGKAHSKSVYEYKDGLPVNNKEYGTGKNYFEEAYTYTDNILTKTCDTNDVTTEYSAGIDWSQSVMGVQGVNSPSITVKNTYYTNSSFVKQVSSGDYVNNITYNTEGAISTAQYGSAQSADNRSEITFEYNTFGNMSKAVIGGVALVTCEYDYKHLNKITYANGDSVEYTYDSKNRITAVTDSGGYSATVAYADNSEDTVTITDTNGVQYQSGKVNKDGKTSEFTASFDGDSTLLKVVGLAMNGAGNITTTEIYAGGGETPFERVKTVVDRNGQITELKREINGASCTYAHDELYRLKSKSTKLSSKTFKYEYDYQRSNDDKAYPRIGVEQLSIGTKRDKFSYIYHANGYLGDVFWNDKSYAGYAFDKYGRLTEENNYTFGERYECKYDANGNIVSKKTIDLSTGATLSTSLYDYTTVTAGSGQNAAWGDQLKSYNGNALQYDRSGNPTVYLGKRLTWNARKLVKIDGTTMQYDYNGMRVKKGGKRYFWQGDSIRMEQDDVNHSIYYYYDESGVCGMNCDGTDYYFRKNMLGDICAVYDGTGELLCRYVYDAWGNHRLYDKDGNRINDDGTNIGSKNPFRYRGYYWDREFGLYYLQSRYYDPALGRFISPDGIKYLDPNSIVGMNLYAYCNDNPIMNIDPNGNAISMLAITIGFLVLTTVAGGVWAGVDSYKKGNRGWDVVGDVLLGMTIGLAAGGAVVATAGIVLISFNVTVIAGFSVAKLVAIGIVAYNAIPAIVAPIMGIKDAIVIEYEGNPYAPPEPNPTPPISYI